MCFSSASILIVIQFSLVTDNPLENHTALVQELIVIVVAVVVIVVIVENRLSIKCVDSDRAEE